MVDDILVLFSSQNHAEKINVSSKKYLSSKHFKKMMKEKKMKENDGNL